MPVGELYRVAAEFRAALLRRERAAASEMVRAYGQVWRRLRDQINALTQRYHDAQAAGEDVSEAWLFEFDRLQALLDQTEREIAGFARHVDESVKAQQREAIDAAGRHARALTRAAYPAEVAIRFTEVPTDALEDLVGFLQDGSPLRSLLDELGPEASESMRKTLITGLATGLGPREIARQAKAALGNNLTRALRIARTETLRAYREATRRNYLENSDIVPGWIWLSALDKRTCLVCLLQHGTKHKLEEELNDHPNGRCSMLPMTVSWEQLGIQGVQERPELQSGTEWLDKANEDIQRKAFGNGTYGAWSAGKVGLDGWLAPQDHGVWGMGTRARSLAEMIGQERAWEWMTGTGEALEYENVRAQVVFEWTRGSNRPSSIALKYAVKAEFGLGGEVFDRHQRGASEEQIARWRSVVRRIYDDTQEALREQKIQSIMLYRGLKTATPKPGVLEAWTSDWDTAVGFNGFDVRIEEMPAGRIFLYYGGPGWKDGPFGQQWEYLVFSGAPR